jgi:arylsulfatase B
MEATEEDLQLYSHLGDETRQTYAAMMHAMDRGVGRILDWLDKSGELSNTLIVFFSDNGGATNNSSWNGSLSGAKGVLLEGGIRIPMIWSWPGRIPAGKRHDSPVSSLDLLPTFLAAAQAEPLAPSPPRPHEDPANCRRATELYGAYDGINLLPTFTATTPPPDRTLFWRLQGQRAVLHGADKLIVPSHRPPQLFQPKGDPGEATDHSAQRTGTLKDLFKRLGEWESSLATVPLWDSSPRWWGESAQIYETHPPRPEPR